MGKAHHDAMLDSIMSLISKYDIGANKTHFSIVTYASSAQIRVSLNDPNSYSQGALGQLIQEMKDKDKLSSPTRTDRALKKVCESVFVTEGGDRPESPNVMIIFTDGGTHKKSEPYDTVLQGCEVSNEFMAEYPFTDA